MTTENASARAGTDYSNTTTIVTFTNSVSSQTVGIPIIDNSQKEGNREFLVKLSNPTGGASLISTQAAVRILDDEVPAGTPDPNFIPGAGANGIVNAVGLTAGGGIYIGGEFTEFDGAGRTNVALLSSVGQLDTAFTPVEIVNVENVGATNVANPGIVRSIVVYTNGTNAGKVLVVGEFDFVGGVSRPNIARLNPDGTLDSSFNPGAGADNVVLAAARQDDDRVVIAGLFSTFDGQVRNFVARLTENGSLDATFDPGAGADAPIRALALDGAGRVLVGGEFTQIDGVGRNRIARLNSNGAVDKTFDPGMAANNAVNAITVGPDRFPIIGGLFTNVNGVARNRIVKLDEDGNVDLSFDPPQGADQFVSALALQSDGKILIGGGFTTIGGVTRNRITRLNTDGTVDSSYNVGSGADEFIAAIAMQNDGAAVVGGAFTTINGRSYPRVARIVTGENVGVGSFDLSAATYLVDENGTNVTVTIIRNGGLNNVQTNVLTQDLFSDVATLDSGSNVVSGFNQVRLVRSVSFGVDTLVTQNFFGTNLMVGTNIFAGTNIVVETNALGATNLIGTNIVVGTNQVFGTNLLNGASVLVRTNDLAATNFVGGLNSAVGTNFVQLRLVTADSSAIAFAHYNSLNATVTFPSGVSQANYDIGIINNGLVDGNKSFNVFTPPSGGATLGATTNAVVTIRDDDSVIGYAPTSYSVNEAGRVVTISVSRAGGTVNQASVDFFTENDTAVAGAAGTGADYVSTNGTLLFLPGQSNISFTVNVHDNLTVDGNRRVNLRLTNGVGFTQLGADLATLTIVDNEFGPGTITFASTAFSASETNGTATISVLRTNGSQGAVSADFGTLTSGSAVASADYQPASVRFTWADGDVTSREFDVVVIDNFVTNVNRTVDLLLTNFTGGSIGGITNATLSILDNDSLLTFTNCTNLTVSEAGLAAAISVARYGPANDAVSVSYGFSDGTAQFGATNDFVGTNGILSFNPGDTNLTFTLSLVDDAIVEGDETIFIALTNPVSIPAGSAYLGISNATLTVIDDDTEFDFQQGSYTVAENVGSVLLTVVRVGLSSSRFLLASRRVIRRRWRESITW